MLNQTLEKYQTHVILEEWAFAEEALMAIARSTVSRVLVNDWVKPRLKWVRRMQDYYSASKLFRAIVPPPPKDRFF